MKKRLLNPILAQDVELRSFCSKIVRFVRWQKYWPSAGDLHRKYNKPGKGYWTLAAIRDYCQIGLERGWLQKTSSSAWRLTDKYYQETFTEPIEALYSSSAGARKNQKTFLSKLHQNIRRLKRAGLYEELEIDEYERTKGSGNPTSRQQRYGEASRDDWDDDGRTGIHPERPF